MWIWPSNPLLFLLALMSSFKFGPMNPSQNCVPALTLMTNTILPAIQTNIQDADWTSHLLSCLAWQKSSSLPKAKVGLLKFSFCNFLFSYSKNVISHTSTVDKWIFFISNLPISFNGERLQIKQSLIDLENSFIITFTIFQSFIFLNSEK